MSWYAVGLRTDMYIVVLSMPFIWHKYRHSFAKLLLFVKYGNNSLLNQPFYISF